MIENINIENFKCLSDENITFKPLTIITGENSSGKSTLIQSLLLYVRIATTNGERLLSDNIPIDFSYLRNKYTNSSSVKVNINDSTYNYEFSDTNSLSSVCNTTEELHLEENVYYMSADRVGVENRATTSNQYKCGINGEFLYGTYQEEKSNPLDVSLVKNDSSYTLSMQINHWLNYITDIKTELKTEKTVDEKISITYTSDGLPNMLPTSLGTGVSYITKILILCLRAKKGDVIIIENSEIHLHPASQAKMGEFFAFIAAAGIQVIIETHSEHLINMVAYEVYEKKLSSEDVTILYKSNVHEKFKVINLKEDGKFEVDFPEGFFDATLEQLMKME